MELENRFPFAIVVSFSGRGTSGRMTLSPGEKSDMLNDPEYLAFSVPPHVDLSDATQHGERIGDRG